MENTYPTTVKDAVARLLSEMNTKNMMIIRSARKENLIDVYFAMGMEIRNSCGLWAGNTALLKDTNAIDPDGASMVIIEALWKELRGIHITSSNRN
ncbi:MAG: DUF6794 domain-containing protein [Nitrospirota bacterium]